MNVVVYDVRGARSRRWSRVRKRRGTTWPSGTAATSGGSSSRLGHLLLSHDDGGLRQHAQDAAARVEHCRTVTRVADRCRPAPALGRAYSPYRVYARWTASSRAGALAPVGPSPPLQLQGRPAHAGVTASILNSRPAARRDCGGPPPTPSGVSAPGPGAACSQREDGVQFCADATSKADDPEDGSRLRRQRDRAVADRHNREGKFPLEIVKRMGSMGFLGMLVPGRTAEPGRATWPRAGAGGDQPRVRLDRRHHVGAELARQRPHRPLGKRRSSSEGSSRSSPPRRGSGRLRALSEPGSGSDAAPASVTSAVKDGNDYVLNGTKNFITTGAEADLVLAHGADGHHRTRRAASRRSSADAAPEGFRGRQKEDKLGLRASSTVQLMFEAPRAGVAHAGRSRKRLQDRDAHARRRPHRHRGPGVGIAQACLDASVKYARRARSIRSADRQVQAIQFKHRQHGDASSKPRACSCTNAACAQGRREAARHGSRHGEALFIRDRATTPRRRGGPDPRRRGLHSRISGRALTSATRASPRSTRRRRAKSSASSSRATAQEPAVIMRG